MGPRYRFTAVATNHSHLTGHNGKFLLPKMFFFLVLFTGNEVDCVLRRDSLMLGFVLCSSGVLKCGKHGLNSRNILPISYHAESRCQKLPSAV